MLERIKIFAGIFAFLILFGGCRSAVIPARYNLGPPEVSKSFTGCWIDILSDSGDSAALQINLSGELIALQVDTAYILTEISFTAIPVKNIKSAKLYVFKPQGAMGPVVGLLSFIPNVAGEIANSTGGGFLLLGLPVAATGILFGLGEAQSNATLKYPDKNSFNEFVKFARFPQGLPSGLETEKLHLLR
jgi:hypothetical protein